MLASIAVALALASPLMLDVPYLPQSDALCGGAAAAMVFRYWGDTHASVQEFAALVDRRGGGIADDVLASDIRQRGWNAERFEGSIALLRDRLERREPVVVLLADRGTRYHYVVVVGLTDDGVIVHDPSWGPSRTIREAEFVRLWEPSRFWALLVRPGDDAIVTSGPSAQLAAALSSSSIPQRNACDALLNRAIADIAARGLSAADTSLATVREQCPESPARLDAHPRRLCTRAAPSRRAAGSIHRPPRAPPRRRRLRRCRRRHRRARVGAAARGRFRGNLRRRRHRSGGDIIGSRLHWRRRDMEGQLALLVESPARRRRLRRAAAFAIARHLECRRELGCTDVRGCRFDV